VTSNKQAFDKYALYTKAVQSPQYDARFLRSLYRELVGAEPITLREDFCGTHALACAWVRLRSDKKAAGIDIDSDPLKYGALNNVSKLTPEQRKRLRIEQGNILTSTLRRADVACAFNFSYFCLHSRAALVSYFKRVRASLKPHGIFVVDIFGGPDHAKPYTDSRSLPGVRYRFEQEDFDPISRKAKFKIHLHPRGGRMQRDVFTYDWRMWTIPEVRDAMADAGLRKTVVYWEGTARNGRGSGRYYRRDRGEACRVWTAYVVGL